MENESKKSDYSSLIFRFAISCVISITAANIIFILICSFILITGASDKDFIPKVIFSIGLISGLTGGLLTFKKIFRYLEKEMKA